MAPSRANRLAVASPSPELPPVTTATFPACLSAWIFRYSDSLMSVSMNVVNRGAHSSHRAYRDKWSARESLRIGVDNQHATAAPVHEPRAALVQVVLRRPGRKDCLHV